MSAERELQAEPPPLPPERPRSGWGWQGVAIALVFYGALFAFAYPRYAANHLRSYDGPWHLLTGRIIVETGHVPRTDPICFSSTGLDWVNLSWLAELVTYGLFLWLGFAGPAGLATLLFGLLLVATLWNLRARRVSPLLTLAAFGVTFYSLGGVYGIRPRAFTFALLAVLLALLDHPDPEHRLPTGRAVAVLVLLLIWNHLHGGFVYAYALLGLDALGACADSRRRGGPLLPRRARLLGAIIGVGLASFALHPHGFTALIHAATYTRQFSPAVYHSIEELMPLDFTASGGLFIEAYLAVAIVALVWGRGPLRTREVLVFLVFLHLSLHIWRGVFPLVLLTVPVVAERLTGRLAALRVAWPRVAWSFRAVERRLLVTARSLPFVLAAAVLLWLAIFVPRRASRGVPGDLSGFDPAILPVEATRFIRDSGIGGRIFDVMHAGGLLGWALYPARRIALDGRSNLHCQGEAQDRYEWVCGLGPGWKALLDEDEVELVLMPKGAALPRELRDRFGWRWVYEGDRYVVAARP